MNLHFDSENLAPPSARNQQRMRKPFGLRDPNTAKPLRKSVNNASSAKAFHDSSAPKRRALGDITNRSASLNQSNNPSTKPSFGKPPSKTALRPRFDIPLDLDGKVLDPEYIPHPSPPSVYTPVLFEDDEFPIDDSEEDGGLDEFGKPFERFTLSHLAKETKPPFDTTIDDDHDEHSDIFTRGPQGYFHPDQLIRKDEMPLFELA